MVDNEQTSDEPKISESTTGIVLALIFFFPLGFYWLWKQPDWPSGKRRAFAVSGIIWVTVLGAANDDDSQVTPSDGVA